ncbi:MAG: hypothetical protein A2X08_02810 [Bacteroidetes bacterium GWA2_32_17]|nr:MAG: hypothetical protein A2X08_02810 [Bacteroidetes bacterium GWA2_32_17]
MHLPFGKCLSRFCGNLGWASCFAQPRLILNNNIYVNIRNSAYLIINNSAANAITTLGTGGNIISESELNRIKWNIETATGTYIVPFTKSPGNKIPVTVNINTAGAGSGSILFSTYSGSTWDNNTYKPSDVANMGNISGSNNSAYVIDRFWLIDAISYTTKPTATFAFTYLDAEWAANGGNTITESNLGAQRFNSTIGTWWGYNPQGTINTGSNTVTTVPVIPANFFRSWTLTDNSSPLPIELLYYTAILNPEKKVLNQWATASEINNDYFVVERTIDGIKYEFVGKVNGAGNSNSTLYYSATDPDPYHGVSYYRLKQVDFDGSYTYSQLVPVNLENLEIIIIYPNPASDYFDYLVGSSQADIVTITVINTLGQTVIKTEENIDKGITKKRLNVSSLANGTYMLIITTAKMKKTQKQFIIK